MGYLGGGILFLLNVVMTLNPSWFGLADAAEAVRWSFFTVALWWGFYPPHAFLGPGTTTRQESCQGEFHC